MGDRHQEFRDELVRAGVLVETGVLGVHGWSGDFDRVLQGVDAIVTAELGGSAERMVFSPIVPRVRLEETGYLHSFPHLAGSVFAFDGSESQAQQMAGEADVRADWSHHLTRTDLTLVPAACYPVYPALGAQGVLPVGGRLIDAGAGWVFRHEPSVDPARLQSFRTRELVRVGEPDEVAAWRDDWCQRAVAILTGLGLAAEAADAADPFFGRAGRMLAASQRQQRLKFEVVVPVASAEPTAVASFNYHQEHFSGLHDIRTHDGAVAHTACLGFGLERIVLALLAAHGLEPQRWPDSVKAALWP
jgi:seryl-tRNA synthetase